MTLAVLAQAFEMDGDHMGEGWWWVMGVGWLVFLALIIVVAVVLTRSVGSSNRRPRALDVLDERFARGEIDVDEYRQRQDALRR